MASFACCMIPIKLDILRQLPLDEQLHWREVALILDVMMNNGHGLIGTDCFVDLQNLSAQVFAVFELI